MRKGIPHEIMFCEDEETTDTVSVYIYIHMYICMYYLYVRF